MSLPPGFDGLYRCKNHPERDAVSPIALRWCEQCHDDARARYAEQHAFKPQQRYQDERTTDDRSIYLDHMGWYKPTKETV